MGGIKITGLKKIENDLKRAINTKLSAISADLYIEEIKDNLKKASKTGNLAKSFTAKRKGKGKSIVVSDAEYAAIQNYGGKIRVTDKMRKKMWALYKETGNSMYKAIALTKKSFITIKAKNYLDIKNERSYIKKVDVRFNKIIKRL